MSRAALSVERVEFNPDDETITVYERQDRSPSQAATYTMMEFMALLAGHIPSPYESMTYYYGIYSSSHRGKEKRENGDGLGLEVKEQKGLGKSSSTWSRLIHRIFEVNPLKCRKCGGNMRLIAFITQRSETMRILQYIGEQTKKGPPLRAKFSPENPQQTLFREYIPSVEAYIGDPQYVN